MMKTLIFSCFALLFAAIPFRCFSQKAKLEVNEGNEAYLSGRYDEAIQAYTEALAENPDYAEALFNTGNALQEQSRRLFEKAESAENPQEKQELTAKAKELSKKAASQFATVAKAAETREAKNKSNYNLGNARLLSGEIDQSIEAYKEALRNDPTDDDARYNLAYAQQLKKQNQSQDQKKQDQQNQKQQQDQEKKDQEKKDQKQDEGEPKEQEPQDTEEKGQSEQRDMTKEEAERLLKALMKQEKDLQEELKRQKHKAARVKIEKDW